MNSKSLVRCGLLLAGIGLAGSAFAATGFFDNLYVITSLNSGSNVFNQVLTGTTPGTGAASGHNLVADGVNPQFLNFGTLNQSDTLVIKGFEYKTFNDSGSNVTHANLYWKVYPTLSPGGSYTQIVTNTPTNTSGNNKTWQVTNGAANILTGLSNGNYTLQVYTESFTNGFNTAGNIYGFVDGTNPTATFSVIPEPGSIVLMSIMGSAFATVALLRRRKKV